jgi:F-type H+-transporting ATPase subunit b
MLKKIIFFVPIFSFVFLIATQSAKGAGMPQLDPYYWISQIFWLILSFGVLFLILSKIILPKISRNLETRKSQILENIELAEKQRLESENKIKEFEKLILEGKNQAKNYFSDTKQKIIEDINKKKTLLENEINEEIKSAEKEINDLKNNAPEKINKIAVETSVDLIKQLIGFEVNNSNISAIVEDLSKKSEDKQNAI